MKPILFLKTFFKAMTMRSLGASRDQIDCFWLREYHGIEVYAKDDVRTIFQENTRESTIEELKEGLNTILKDTKDKYELLAALKLFTECLERRIKSSQNTSKEKKE